MSQGSGVQLARANHARQWTSLCGQHLMPAWRTHSLEQWSMYTRLQDRIEEDRIDDVGGCGQLLTSSAAPSTTCVLAALYKPIIDSCLNAIAPFVFRNFVSSSFHLWIACWIVLENFSHSESLYSEFLIEGVSRWVYLCSSDGNELSRPGRYAVSAHHYELPR
jgi:hypothetical protein